MEAKYYKCQVFFLRRGKEEKQPLHLYDKRVFSASLFRIHPLLARQAVQFAAKLLYHFVNSARGIAGVGSTDLVSRCAMNTAICGVTKT